MYISDVPQRIIIVGVAFLNLLIRRMTAMGMSANTKALTTTPPPATSSMPSMRAKAAPNPAPEDIPIVYGSARGFFRMLCIAVPHIASANPQTIAPMILGILSSRTTHASVALSWGMLMISSQMMWYTSDIERGYVPRVMEYARTMRQSTTQADMNSTLRTRVLR